MSLAQHHDARLRFQQQVDNSARYVVPFIEEKFPLTKGMKVMEIGCGEGGVLKPFMEKGCFAVGVDLVASRIALAGDFLRDYISNGQLRLINQNIYDLDFLGEFKDSFDLIILKDAIEHIPEQEKLMGYLKQLLKPDGVIFLGFPPWYMPHGGHQQICKNKMLSVLPYIHLLPASIYRGILKNFKENESTVKELLEIKETGISIERFEHILKKNNYAVLKKRFYLINPIYQYKFGWKPRKQSRLLASIPYFRDFVTTCVYYLVKDKN
ncbi:MAG: class I SAM-dependent methyltransferase [Chitinophagaceae bacterium]|jgi:SAM-dependent methyltransferase|nr:MAG: class I SAM-dependent methyltransferase [Chitinophagaceae bacterium]